MLAIRYHRYGSTSVLKPEEVPIPHPRKNELVVSIKACALNPIDLERRKGRVKLLDWQGFPRIPGCDFSGEVVKIGRGVKGFEEGDLVYGMKPSLKGGACAEYVRVHQDHLAAKPGEVSFEEAAGFPLAALTAYQAFQELFELQPGQRILINGASGGVGVFAVQIARAMGARVTGVCSFRNLTRVRSLGAERVIDYTKDDLTALNQRFDHFFDVYGNYDFWRVRHLLEPRGRFVSTIPHPKHILNQFLTTFSPQKAFLVVVKSRRRDLEALSEMVEKGELKPVVDRIYPLRETATAMDYLQTRRAQGKVVLSVGKD